MLTRPTRPRPFVNGWRLAPFEHISAPVARVLKALTVCQGPWTITFEPPPIPARGCDYAFVHDDFDASWEGEETGYVGNGLCGRGASVEDCLAQIADIEAGHREAAE